MPYPRWLETLDLYADRPAIHEDGRVTTFAELGKLVASLPPAVEPVLARTGSVDFFARILQAWRDGQAVIPVEKDAPGPVLAHRPPEGICLVKYTPGASGVPRGILLTGQQLMADAERIVKATALEPERPNLGVISLAHSYGFSNVVLPLLFHGVPVHLSSVPFPRAIEAILTAHGPLVVPAVPSMWRAWHRAGILKDAPILLAISAGAPLSLELEREVFETAGLKIHNFYGTSECGGISMDLTAVPRESADDVGTVFPGVNVVVGAAGRLLVRSDAVAAGYDLHREDDLLDGDCYLTRDLGEIDAQGRIHLTGTLGGAINVAGRKVSPAKVEAAILATGLVSRIQVHAVKSNDPERFEEIAAEVALKRDVTLDQLKSATVERLQLWEIPRHWQQVTSPGTING